MVDSNSLDINSLDIKSIVNILTLRYDPTIIPNLTPKNWKDFVSDDKPISYENIEEMISEEISKKIDHIGSQGVCIALSGGVDSALMLCLTRKLFPNLKINAVSIRFSNSIDETGNAAKIAENFEAEHHIIDIDNYLEELPKAISIIKQPFWDLHWYYVVKKSSKLGNILISGDGGDEIFGGYTFRYEKFLKNTKIQSNSETKTRNYLDCHERDHVPDQEKIFGEKISFSWNLISESIEPYFNNPLTPIEQVFLADYNGKLLYNFNPINSRICNYFGVTVLAPMLSEKIISSGIKIPQELKYDQKNNVGKLPLRRILEKHKIENLVSNQKLGFNVNTVNLWKSYGFDICSRFIESSNIIENGLISKEWVEKHLSKDQNDVRYINKFYGLLAFEIWVRLFLIKDLSPETKLN